VKPDRQESDDGAGKTLAEGDLAMAERAVVVPEQRRGSSWGADGLYYPSTEERDVPLSGPAIHLIFYLYSALRRLLYPRHPQVYVAADQFIYYKSHDPSVKVAPDVWVCCGVPQEPERDVFRTWDEGATPGFVAEISSLDSRTDDRVRKFALYQDALRCREYLIYDEDLDELLLYRRVGEKLALVPPAADGRVYSEEMDAWFRREPGLLVRVYGPDGEPVPDVEELVEDAARIRRHLEEETRELTMRINRESQRADQESRRAAGLEMEVERLRTEIARLRDGREA